MVSEEYKSAYQQGYNAAVHEFRKSKKDALDEEYKSAYKQGYNDAAREFRKSKNDVLDEIKAVIACNIVEDDTSGNTPARLRADWDAANKAHMIDIAIIDRYRDESKE